MFSNAPPFSVVVVAPVVLDEFSVASHFVLQSGFFFVTFFGALAAFAIVTEIGCDSMRPAVRGLVAIGISSLCWGQWGTVAVFPSSSSVGILELGHHGFENILEFEGR